MHARARAHARTQHTHSHPTPSNHDPQALARAMSGNYVNFGVFELYGDTALRDALDAALRMVTSIPQADVMGFK